MKNQIDGEERLGFRCGQFDAGQIQKPYRRYFRDVHLLSSYVGNRARGANSSEAIRRALVELDGLVSLLSRKPNLCFLGEFDAGKSTLANVLMGADSLPAKIAPHTALPTVVRHTDDRAAWMDSEIYFLNSFLPPVRWDDRSSIESHLITHGSLDLLEKATHKQSMFQRKAPEEFKDAQMALAFVDSPLLDACNIIDFPGYGHDEHDEVMAQRFETLADVVIYLSPINGFLKSQELFRLGQVLSKIGDLEQWSSNGDIAPLGNVFIVASHADPRRYDSSDISDVFQAAGVRIMRQLGEFSIQEKSDRIGIPIGIEQIQSRLFLFWKGKEETCVTLDHALQQLLAVQLPQVWWQRAQSEIEKFKGHKVSMVGEMVEIYETRLADLQQMEKVYHGYVEREPERKHQTQQKVEGIVSQIRAFSKQSCKEFAQKFGALTEPATLERLIREKFSEKREGEEYAFGYVQELANKALKEILTPKTKRISDATEVFVNEYHEQRALAEMKINVGLTADDMGTFLTGAAATGTLGGLASLGLVYGGTWLAAHTTGLLAAAGAGAASIGAAVATGIGYALSALTGPIGIAIVSGLALFALFRAPWQKRLAEEVAKKMQAEDVSDQFLKAIRQYWNETESAFLGGVSELEARWAESLAELRAQVTDPEEGQKQLSIILEEMSSARDFFLEIPWQHEN